MLEKIRDFKADLPLALDGIYEFDNHTPVSNRVLEILDYSLSILPTYSDTDYALALNAALGIVPEMEYEPDMLQKYYTIVFSEQLPLEAELMATTLSLYLDEVDDIPVEVLKCIGLKHPFLILIHLLNVIYDVTFIGNPSPVYSNENIREYICELKDVVHIFLEQPNTPLSIIDLTYDAIIPNIRVLEEVLYG